MAISYYAPIVFLGVWGGGIGGMLLYEHWHRTRERKRLIERPTLKAIPVIPMLPTVRPAYHFDHSDTSEAALTYCPVCALESVAAQNFRDGDGFYPMPRGVPSFCAGHEVIWNMRAAEENA
jgi:hypothetical protein